MCVNEWEYYFLPWRIKHGPVQPSSEPRSDAEPAELYSISLLEISLLLNSSISSDVISDVFKNWRFLLVYTEGVRVGVQFCNVGYCWYMVGLWHSKSLFLRVSEENNNSWQHESMFQNTSYWN